MSLSDSQVGHLSPDHEDLLRCLLSQPRCLIIQDLDGVCMGLVRDPLSRELSADYLQAAKKLSGSFYVLTNGEHIGLRGVNGLVDRAVGGDLAKQNGLYLPGLGAGGVQWQDQFARVNHPGVSEQEITFLASLPAAFKNGLSSILTAPPYDLETRQLERLLAVAVLDNPVSPTININEFRVLFVHKPELLLRLQQDIKHILEYHLEQAEQKQLADSFFIHYAPNLGRDKKGERLKWSQGDDIGTTDFQFMLNGAIKEVGVLYILNQYYFELTGSYPLGQDFNVRQAPRDIESLVNLVVAHFDPAHMPKIMGVGDTVTSQPESDCSKQMLRGGSDRGFLTLIQRLGEHFHSQNFVVFVDSSGGELVRPAINPDLLDSSRSKWSAVAGITDAEDPLRINYVFPNGHSEYISLFCRVSEQVQNQ